MKRLWWRWRLVEGGLLKVSGISAPHVSRWHERLSENLRNNHAPARTWLAELWPRCARGGVADEAGRAEPKVFRRQRCRCRSRCLLLSGCLFICRGGCPAGRTGLFYACFFFSPQVFIDWSDGTRKSVRESEYYTGNLTAHLFSPF